jgi:hypothetical protein
MQEVLKISIFLITFSSTTPFGARLQLYRAYFHGRADVHFDITCQEHDNSSINSTNYRDPSLYLTRPNNLDLLPRRLPFSGFQILPLLVLDTLPWQTPRKIPAAIYGSNQLKYFTPTSGEHL